MANQGMTEIVSGATHALDGATIGDGSDRRIQTDKTHYLTMEEMPTLVAIVKDAINAKGPDYYAWRNSPVIKDGQLLQSQGWGASAKDVPITTDQAINIYDAKLNGAYAERFAITVALLGALVTNGNKVALLQIHKEEGVPFDATGWVVVSVNGYPLFHIAPHDLSLSRAAEANLITTVVEGSPEAEVHKWKGTNKVQELSLLLGLGGGVPRLKGEVAALPELH